MVFYISVIIVALFVLWGAINPDNLASFANEALGFTIQKFGWLYLLAAFAFLVFSLFLAFSKYGHIRLGSDDDDPEYSNRSWFAMLFSAGMGIGLVFWGVAEPIYHYITPPMGEAQTADAARMALRFAFFHWGLHPWGIYTVIALALAYFQYRKGYRGLISWTFYPLLGERVKGPIGRAIDILAIIATSFGVATSLGLGTLQINGGLGYLFGIPANAYVQVTIIGVVTILYMLSATTGLDKGIRILSNANLLVALGLLLTTLLLGPTFFLFDIFTTILGSYLQNLIQMSLRLAPFTQNPWVGDWTLFYWAWWIAWAPFVGMFIARVSRGRTIKEFVLGVLLIPSLFSFFWFSVFGGTALHFEIFEKLNIAEAVQNDVTTALFTTLGHLPFGTFLSLLATLLIITFFITSADSATFVLGMLSSEGQLNPTNRVKITWGFLQSSIAIVLLLSGGLQALQTASIVAAFPFAIIMGLMCVSILRALEEEAKEERRKEKKRRKKLDKLIENE
ncbi:BCCT family transporter [Ammoniphilus sp. CFH 90114]|uniref:glycine betaine uptake BCCT transporter n=1 Tax=Ammoniphilus sp. CFH 90114 TaxID=2493665 RepID=UPI00100EFB8A|nr:BCCT family transporter [Ammoniphilus sp. CFH 90114]RXT04917.1 BCCT family transporter [Ammoniphilus sp. CFH 90114]